MPGDEGGQSILFPSDTLDKREEPVDVFGYLDNWADMVIIRHKDIRLLEEAAEHVKVPVINAMTDQNHPCEVLGFKLSQCCGAGYEMDGVEVYYEIEAAIKGKDIICTDSLSGKELQDFKDCQVTKAVMDMANRNAILNPCPPFYRGEEVSEDAIESACFAGYAFKKSLLTIQQAVMVWCM